MQFRPMGLNLYYQLNAHSDTTGEPGALRTQLLFGLALKAIHDFSSIDSSTKVFDPAVLADTLVFPSDLQGTDKCFASCSKRSSLRKRRIIGLVGRSRFDWPPITLFRLSCSNPSAHRGSLGGCCATECIPSFGALLVLMGAEPPSHFEFQEKRWTMKWKFSLPKCPLAAKSDSMALI